ncbi:DUF1615 domain-containing protein [Tatumella citrea]|uniref:DUF1615 domain-containing protein n=1 Tax=Tatumella citrea TaxID=53336 RepID=A0A1Y0LQ17_TATCI|nr:DUF1615 domain-containing protein [Tatumella citrea]ARU96070.1 hypothetical protein A7K98_06455 [Tatumella citrea]ARV00107.1 hypothetical protein A7K99_06455 [Tatumella citrea]
MLVMLLLNGCSQHSTTAPVQQPVTVKAKIQRLLPPTVTDKAGWSEDIYQSFHHQSLPPSASNLCAVIAVAGQESGFNPDAPVNGLPDIALKEIYRRAATLYIPQFLVNTALKIPSSDGRSYAERLRTVHTEKQLSDIFDDLIDRVPLGQRLFGNLNPVHTGGPMQVSIAFAEAHATGYPWPVKHSVRQEVFSRRGGVWFGTLHLLGYPTDYPAMLYRFADFNAGWYASRNAAFQAAVMQLTGRKLALDGDLVRYDSDAAGATEQAVLSLQSQLGLSAAEIHRQLAQGESPDFQQSRVWQQVFRLADKQQGSPLPRQRLPGIELHSPKITRNLTTAWFAQRVNSRYQQCLTRQ